jgi:hypothetical protein
VVLQNDANLVEYSALGRPAWATNTYRPPPVGGDSLISGQTMVANDVLHSASRGYLFAMQPDGNVVIYEGARAVWWSGTGGHPGAQLSMQPDGNVVLYSVAGQPLWSTGTYGHPGSRLTMQPDGNVVVYSAANQPLWNTGVDLLSSTAWLAELNRYRAAAGIGPVVENNTWSGGLWLHLQYLTFTTPDYFVSPYLTLDTENPFSPTATTRGTQEAAAAGSYILPAPAPPTTLLDINRWFSAPFRAIGLMRPGLSQVGFATGFGAAAMDVRSGLANTAASAPILFPGPGVTTGLRTLSGDSPDPLESCPQGWTPPFGSAFGQALIALLPSAPQVGMQASVTGPTGSLSTTTGGLCMINENTYQSSDPSYAAAGASTLQDAHGVILIINQPYKPGTYTATITPSNAPPIVWSFNVS